MQSHQEYKVYPFGTHGISLEQIDPDALYIMEKLRSAGFVAYLVGGGVRDLLLNHTPKDFDISTSAEPEQVKKLFRNCILIGRRFRLAHIRFGKKIIEVATFRSGDPENDALILRDNQWGTPQEDALRRDFTINGLFYDPADQTLIDYVGGYADIQCRMIRTIGQPFLRFRQDPVRMIRLLKFQARFGLEVEPSARIALLENRGEIVKSSPNRVQEELLRMLESGAAKPFFKLLTEHGMLHLLMPLLGEYLESPEGETVFPYLHEIDTTFHAPANPRLDRALLLASLIFPLLEKRITIHYSDRERVPHLGEILDEVHHLLSEIFNPFLNIPRRLRGSLAAILTAQYRLTPLEKRKHRKLRVPHDADFPLAVQFLQLRACLEPALQATCKEWQEALALVELPPAAPPRRRRPRRRKPSDSP